MRPSSLASVAASNRACSLLSHEMPELEAELGPGLGTWAFLLGAPCPGGHALTCMTRASPAPCPSPSQGAGEEAGMSSFLSKAAKQRLLTSLLLTPHCHRQVA